MPAPAKLSPTLALARELLQRESVTPDDAGCQELLLARLQKIGFVGEWLNRGAVTNLWATRAGANADGGPLFVFAGHTDVVPTGPVQQWQHPPFGGVLADGKLHGRGAADMKGSVAAFITACERWVARQAQYVGAIGILLTSDEEGAAQDGTRYVMEELTARGQQIDMCIVGEPSSDQQFGDTVKVGRRGSVGATLRLHGKQAHIAYARDNIIHTAARVIHELTHLTWDGGAAKSAVVFPPTALQVSNFHAGTGADNVIPGEAEIQFNVRFSPQTTAAEIQTRVEEAVRRHTSAFEITWRVSGAPFYSGEGELLTAVEASIHEITGLTPQRSTSGGTSDGRFIAPAGAQVVEFGPRNATIHQINECVDTADLERLSQIYERALEKILGAR